MCRFQTALEVGERFHELARGLARRGVYLGVRAQATNEVGEEALHRSHKEEREVDKSMPDTAGKVAYLVAQEYAHVNVREDEGDALNGVVKTRPPGCTDAYTAACLVTRECKEADEECKRDEDEDEMRHRG